jgi:type II restriction/modification system DNA methylase subunit YeeA
MCQESLINYLYNKINIKEVELSPQEQAEQQKLFKAKKIEQLKLTQEVIEEIIPKEDIEFFIKTGSSTYVNKSRKLNVTLPDTITNNALILDKALFDIKVCDPAIGSGAFPVGMMNEIVRARAALSEYIGKPDRSIYELKRNAIENSIYGVDIDAGAVDIAKLRFWLSLVVDEEDIKNIKPLPNLDYKIMQGNSLISSYEGIDFDTIVDEYKPDTQFTINLWGDKSQDLKLELKNKQSEFLKTPYATRKIELKKEIEDIIINIVKAKLEVKAKEGKLNLQEMEDKIRNFAQNTENRNFFPWKLFFADAFEQGGFDVVIGNPPYIQLQKFKGQPVQQLYKNANFKVHDSNGDIYCLFYEKGLSLLKHNGNLCFITSNKWMRAGYGEKLREFFVSNNPVELIDFGGFGVFDTATVDVNILLIQKHQNDNKTYSCSLDKNFEGLNQLSVYIRQNSTIQNFDKNTWCILNPIEQSIKSKIEEIGTPLKDWNINIYRGVLTGLNEAFIIDGAKKDELIAKDPKSAEIIRPILRGRDIKRYSYEFADKWLINTHNGSKTQEKIDINDYPVLKEHFDNYYEKLVKRDDQGDTPYNLRCCAYMDDFSKQKIVYSEIVQKPQFYLDQGKFFVEATSFLLTGENLEYLVACFNSKPVTYFFKTFYAGGGLGEKGYRYKKAFLVNLPIPKIKNINYNNDIFKELILQNKTDKIDKIIYEIYNLSSDEIEYIENYYDI